MYSFGPRGNQTPHRTRGRGKAINGSTGGSVNWITALFPMPIPPTSSNSIG